jgi:hypothetical protein
MNEELPKFESRKQYLTRKVGNMYDIPNFDHPLSMRTKYYKVRDRILHHYIGKSFDDAFSYYCTKVPAQYQKLFLEEFENPFSRWSEWSLDESKNIVHIKRERYISLIQNGEKH